MSEANKVVIVGGGIGGLTAIRSLEKKIGAENLVLIEPREYAEVPFAVLRALTDPNDFGTRIRKPWSELTAARRVAASASAIDGDEVVLANGDRIEFAHAIIATGSTTRGYPFIKGGGSATIEARQADLVTEAARIHEASNILIIGGGPIGTELAGEINSTYPDKDVTVVEGGERLLPALSAGAGEKARRVLTARGVKVELGLILKPDNGAYTGPDGSRYEADLVINAIGVQTNAIPVDGESSLNGKGQLAVDRHLRVNGRRNVFAIGDVNDVPEIKLGATARIQAGVAAKNIVALSAGAASPIKTYKAARPLGLVTLGRKGGIAQLPFGRMDFLAGIKQKDLLVSMYLGK